VLVREHNLRYFISARCNIYISRLCHDASPSVRLSVTEVYWRIIANLGFKFDPTLPRVAAVVLLAGAVLLAVPLAAAVLLAGESSRAMLASSRLSCFTILYKQLTIQYTLRHSLISHSNDGATLTAHHNALRCTYRPHTLRQLALAITLMLTP